MNRGVAESQRTSKGEVCPGDGKVGGFLGSRSKCMAFVVGMVGNSLRYKLPAVLSVG